MVAVLRYVGAWAGQISKFQLNLIRRMRPSSFSIACFCFSELHRVHWLFSLKAEKLSKNFQSSTGYSFSDKIHHIFQSETTPHFLHEMCGSLLRKYLDRRYQHWRDVKFSAKTFQTFHTLSSQPQIYCSTLTFSSLLPLTADLSSTPPPPLPAPRYPAPISPSLNYRLHHVRLHFPPNPPFHSGSSSPPVLRLRHPCPAPPHITSTLSIRCSRPSPSARSFRSFHMVHL